ncbi:glycine--tRNA ligase subunit beta [Granulicella sibirica]|uniref:Glycine--tRNA ligase beta subunit n=1 Tax=Granulicella sibirica TaxID=2479048 RepID=A0A4V1L5U7_9BACT|nr:glycine--tRNA ligase subunit beta [Granulicella sibirica]RXH57004.1 Glycyl-tRNA synthetase beta chain [Granulicella sibirica]
MSDFLFEIGLEEVPARMIAGAQAELERRVVAMLARERLVGADAVAKSYSTPRRLAVLVPGVADRQEDVSEEMNGPSVKVAFKDGVATGAAVAFAKKAGIEVEALRTVTTPKGEYLAATVVKPGRTAALVIAEEMPKELAAIYWAKNMYWRPGKPEKFVRPVRWMVGMLGTEIVLTSFAGFMTNDLTYGHRVLFGDSAIDLADAAGYEEALREAFVIADVEARRHRIRKELDRVCRTVPGMRWREDHALVDKMTHLTEWPSIILGTFQEEYLELPEEVLVTVMRDHQNYFAVENKEGKLAPYFLAVLNTEADERGQAVIRHGNERVLRARFNDARFFWEFDQRTPLMERVKLLEKVTFQKDLGSYATKSERVRGVAKLLATEVATRGGAVDAGALDQAVVLAKTDLTAELVKEFTELQGIVGGLYARAQGYPEAVALAVYDQYLPESMEDSVPRTMEGALLAIADKADTIAGMFGLGLEPTGSKDPFALRRAANGIVKILGETEVPLNLGEIAFLAAPGREEVVRKIELFFAERLEFYLREAKGQAYDVVKAVLAIRADGVRDAVARAEAVTAVRGSADFTAVAGAFKRMTNILAQAREKGFAASGVVDVALLKDAAELGLAEKAASLAPEVARMRSAGDYRGALEAIAGLRAQVDAFFESVMVMDPDAEVRGNRLALLDRVLGDFSGIAEFSEIVVAG